jgi:hypothetical protein
MAVVAAAAVVGLVACGGPSTGHVASLPTSGTPATTHASRGATSATTRPTRNPTQLLDEWAACMRSHGDPEQADPTVDATGVIHITWDPATPGGPYGTFKGGQGNSGPGQYCRSYLAAAQMELTRGGGEKPPDQAQVEKFSQCMRANGIPDFPDPSADGLQLRRGPGSDLDPNDPAFQSASKRCAQKTGVHFFNGTPQPGMIELNGNTTGGAGS